jgi:hypothetical protein
VSFLAVLWLAAAHALASHALASYALASLTAPSPFGGVAGRRTPRSSDDALRAPAPQRLPVVRRTSDQSAPTLRSSAGPAGLASVALPVLSATVARCAAHRLSHAAAARGGHLPYFPTAPPLQG